LSVFARFQALPLESVALLLPQANLISERLMSKREFTDRWLKSLKPARAGRRDMHWDAQVPSFGVRVTDKGAASFVVMRRLRAGGALIRRRVGVSWAVPLKRDAQLPTSLAEAREEARQAIRDMQAGIDPKEKRKAAAGEARRQSESVFGVVAERFIKEHVLKIEKRDGQEIAKLKTGHEVARVIRAELRALWDVPMADLRGEDVAKIVKAMAHDRPYYAHHVFAYVRKMLNWAVAHPEYKLNSSPCDRLSAKELIGARHPRQRVLTDLELTEIWRATAPDALGIPFAPFVRMLMLTGQRLSEVAEAKWTEFDLPAGLWTIPPVRMKGNAAHEVPLVSAVVDLLRALPRGAGPYVFSTTDGHRPISGFSKAKTRLDKMLQGVKPWRFHDLRRTMRTGLGGLPVPTNVAELVIAHAQPGLHKVYDQHKYRDEKLEALSKWTAKLLSIVEPNGGNVLPFSARA
jgi:integrase